MKKAALEVALVVVLALSACTAPREPSKPVQEATATPTIFAPTSTATVDEPTLAPTEAGPCVDRAAFVADVTVPDYSHFEPRESFTKTWRVKNTGTCTWSPSYRAVYTKGDISQAAASIPLATTEPGATLDISTVMTAPRSDGKYENFYQLVNEADDPMPIDDGSSIWTIITVGKVQVTAPPTATSAPASVSSQSTGPGLATVSCKYKANADFVSATLALMNSARAASGLPALAMNDKLNLAAASHSADMACNNFLSHTGWNGSTVASRVAAAGYAASFTEENIYGQPPQFGGDAQAAMDWWMNDPIHRDAILNAGAREVGIGYAAYPRSDLGGYFTVDFGAP